MMSERVTVQDFRRGPMAPRIERAVAAILAHGKIDLREENRIVAVCKRGKERQAIDITELPIPRPRPPGSEWIEAYRQWRGGQ